MRIRATSGRACRGAGAPVTFGAPAHQWRSWIPAGTPCVATALISRGTSVTIRRARLYIASTGALLVVAATDWAFPTRHCGCRVAGRPGRGAARDVDRDPGPQDVALPVESSRSGLVGHRLPERRRSVRSMLTPRSTRCPSTRASTCGRSRARARSSWTPGPRCRSRRSPPVSATTRGQAGLRQRRRRGARLRVHDRSGRQVRHCRRPGDLVLRAGVRQRLRRGRRLRHHQWGPVRHPGRCPADLAGLTGTERPVRRRGSDR